MLNTDLPGRETECLREAVAGSVVGSGPDHVAEDNKKHLNLQPMSKAGLTQEAGLSHMC